MALRHDMKKGDLLPLLRLTLYGDDGEPVEFTPGSTARFRMRLATLTSGAYALDVTDSLNLTSPGLLTYTWQVGDTATAGQYYAEVVITDGSGKPQTFPNGGAGSGHFVVNIWDTLLP